MALPYHPKDWFSHLQTTEYQKLMPDPFGADNAEARCDDGLLVLRTERHAEGRGDQQNASPCGVLVEPVEEVVEWFHVVLRVSVKTGELSIFGGGVLVEAEDWLDHVQQDGGRGHHWRDCHRAEDVVPLFQHGFWVAEVEGVVEV
jgi:hypothetical protein